MTCMMVVSVSVCGPDLGDRGRDIELGEFGSTWMTNDVLIGSDPRCDIVLPELSAVAARVTAASNHKLRYRQPANAQQPLTRVDDRAFDLGPYSIRFCAIRRAA
jgi:hypothetical protein